MVEGETEPSKEHRLVSGPGLRRHIWLHPPSMLDPPFCFLCHSAWLTKGLTSPPFLKDCPSADPVLSSALKGSPVDFTAVSVSAWHLSRIVTCLAAFSVHVPVYTGDIHRHEIHVGPPLEGCPRFTPQAYIP